MSKLPHRAVPSHQKRVKEIIGLVRDHLKERRDMFISISAGGNKQEPEVHVESVMIKDSYALVRLRGRIDAETLPDISGPTVWKEELSGKNIILDFKNVVRIDSATLAALIAAFHNLKSQKKKLGLINAPAMLKNYIEILKVEGMVKVYKSEKTAARAFSR